MDVDVFGKAIMTSNTIAVVTLLILLQIWHIPPSESYTLMASDHKSLGGLPSPGNMLNASNTRVSLSNGKLTLDSRFRFRQWCVGGESMAIYNICRHIRSRLHQQYGVKPIRRQCSDHEQSCYMCALFYIVESHASPLSFHCLLHCELNLVKRLAIN